MRNKHLKAKEYQIRKKFREQTFNFCIQIEAYKYALDFNTVIKTQLSLKQKVVSKFKTIVIMAADIVKK